MDVYPLKFKPIFKERIWGGRRLAEVFGKALPPDVPIGESWELADLPEDKSEIANGPLAGWTLDRALAEFGPAMTGCADYQPPFPLLIKLLDAQDVLSVQVHPDAEACHRMGKGDPKTECWYILDAAPGAVIYKGLKPGTTRQQFADAIEAGTAAAWLNRIEVRPGECHFLPSGTCHAIGAGLLIAEIQQPSDTTYRVFDWNRVGPDGKGRPLHVAEALECIHFGDDDVSVPATTQGRLVDADEFKVDKVPQSASNTVRWDSGCMRAVLVVTGHGRMRGGRETVCFAEGDTLLLPAVIEADVEAETDAEFLVATV